MPRIAIVTDSTAYFTREDKTKYNIETVPVNVLYKGKVYRDGIDLTASQAYGFLEENPEDWATSAPAPGEFLAVFKKKRSEGAEAIICLTLAQSISATLSSAKSAAKIAEKEIPGLEIEVVDSGTAAVGESLLALRLGKIIEEGKSFKEVIQKAEELKGKIKVFILLDTIRYVYRSGRIPEIAARLGSILPLKPTLSVHGGKIHLSGAASSREKSKQNVLKKMKEEFSDDFPQVAITYINDEGEAKEFKEEIAGLFPKANIFITEFSPIVGYATGLNTIGIAYFAK